MSLGRVALGVGLAVGILALLASGPAEASEEPPPKAKEPKPADDDGVIHLDSRRQIPDEESEEGSGSSIRAASAPHREV